MDRKVFVGAILGLVAGGFASFLYFKGYYKKISQEEIDSVKTAFESLNKKNEYQDVKRSTRVDNKKKRVVSADEITVDDDVISLTYYSDGVLADDDYNVFDDVDKYLGVDLVESFKRSEEDSIIIHNEELSCNYEIVKDTRYYSDLGVGD